MIEHTAWEAFWRGSLVVDEGGQWMSRHDDAAPGTLTRADLEEALRVNRALLVARQADVDYLDRRLAREQELIEEHRARMEKHREDARTAPEHITRIRARIVEQEAALVALGEEKRVASLSTRAQKQERVEALLARIKQGDMGAVTELQKLL